MSGFFGRILGKAQEFERLVDSLGGKAKIEQKVRELKKENKSFAISSLFRETHHFDPIIAKTLDPPTSGYSSDCYEVRLT